MERQRSFSWKSTKFLLLSFTFSFCLFILSFFCFWVTKSTPSVQQSALHFKYDEPLFSSSSNLNPPNGQSMTSFCANLSARSPNTSHLADTHLRKPQNPYGAVNVSSLRVTHFKKAQNSSGFVSSLDYDGGEVKENESDGSVVAEKVEMVVDNLTNVDDGNRNSATRQDGLLDKDGIPASEKQTREKSIKDCDVSRGRWVLDENYPLYTNVSCPLIDEGFNCQGNGRLDTKYMKWRWRPQDCDIPRFNATKMLELIKGKRLVFVGDSINRNQWESLLCLLMQAVKDPKKVYENRGRRITKEKGDYSFKFVDYQCSVEFFATHYLVHESKARIGQKRVQTLRIDRIDRGSSRWRGANILIFNTANWWTHAKTQAGNNYYQEGGQIYPHLHVLTAFRRALSTWATWVDRHINLQKTHVFFRSSAPSHFRGGQWNTGGHCKEAINPHNDTSIDYAQKDLIAEEVIGRMRTHITFLNVTRLSAYRVDGHPSIYGSKSGRRGSSRIEDCSHWCLPGVPDTWNQLLYYHLLIRESDSRKLG
ncbi:hypothetical protein Nepgr_029843 [Nepenthes gracilis]|uniref:Trichome birefringence-like N-terminal domain-containing protein n=1 Tax=Nepenthes gracilis TaxID=150966 RepID=A0AAD3TED3_NEPGR|nr:hypothetical protein Nepgr_029843 [Nepenthes gracilis]